MKAEGYKGTVAEFEKLSIEKQNTTKALQTRRVDLYKMVLESPNSFINLIAPVDAEHLEDQLKYMSPAPKLGDLEVFHPTFQMDTRRDNAGSKGAVVSSDSTRLAEELFRRGAVMLLALTLLITESAS